MGADNVGVLIAEAPYKSDEVQLLIDIGTNGELVLGNKEKLISSSCATGPALEGAQLAFGMRAAPGAIERIKVDPETHAVDYKVIGRDAWLKLFQTGRDEDQGDLRIGDPGCPVGTLYLGGHCEERCFQQESEIQPVPPERRHQAAGIRYRLGQ